MKRRLLNLYSANSVKQQEKDELFVLDSGGYWYNIWKNIICTT